MKNTGIYIFVFIAVLLAGCSKINPIKYISDWGRSPDGVWVGPELWANRLQDWRVNNGKLECINTQPMRTVHLTTRKATEIRGNINSSVYININRGKVYIKQEYKPRIL